MGIPSFVTRGRTHGSPADPHRDVAAWAAALWRLGSGALRAGEVVSWRIAAFVARRTDAGPVAWMLAAFLILPAVASAQTPAADTAAPITVDSAAAGAAAAPTAEAEPSAASGLPIFFTLGAGYGLRSDPCAFCAAPENTDSFTGHLSVGKYLVHGIGVGVDASVWRRRHPGPAVADSSGAAEPTKLSNLLGNASLTFSYQVWRLYVRAGVGIAWAHQDVVRSEGGGDTVVRAGGVGLGWSAGAGVTLPLAGPVDLAFFANWNEGRYDLSAPDSVLERGAEHRILEAGFGITLR